MAAAGNPAPVLPVRARASHQATHAPRSLEAETPVKAHLYLAVAALLLMMLRWLASAHVAVVLAGGAVISVPVLAIVAAAAVVVTAAVAALMVYRLRAERAMLAAWRTRTAAA